LLKSGDILFARSGATAGKSYLISERPLAVFASYLIRVQIFPEVSPEYLYAFLNSDDYWRQLVTRGNAQPNANARVLGNIRFPLAPLAEQQRIVAGIGALFAQADAIEAAVDIARKRVDKLDQAILARAFRGELVSQDPDDEPASVLLERIRKRREAEAENTDTKRTKRTPRKKTEQLKLL
jgi:type I restriction enzyme S subunit